MISPIIITKILLPVLFCLQVPDRESIEVLIQKLGSPNFEEREVATKRLLDRWPEAIPALKKALQSPDQETAKRAASILETFDQRPLNKLERFVQEGKVDQATELMARWPKGKHEQDSWQAARNLACKLAKFHKKPDQGIGNKLLKFPDVVPFVLSGKRVTKGKDDRETFLFVRAGEVNLVSARDGSPSESIIFASGEVRILLPNFIWSAVFACDSVNIDKAYNVIIFCDGDVTVKKLAVNCLIIARGKVTCGGMLKDCQIISANTIIPPREPADNCTFIENERKPLGFIQFFDPAKEGITVEEADGGIRVKQLTAGKPFQKAGLHKGDLITSINDKAVASPEEFRKMLRKHLVWEEAMTFHVQRDGKALKLQIPRGPS